MGVPMLILREKWCPQNMASATGANASKAPVLDMSRPPLARAFVLDDQVRSFLDDPEALGGALYHVYRTPKSPLKLLRRMSSSVANW